MTTNLSTAPTGRGSERCKIALEVSRTGTYRWDIDANEVEWDEFLCELYGVPPEKYPRTIDEFLNKVHPADRARVKLSIEETLRTERDMDLVLRIQRADGKIVWLSDKTRVFRADDGHRVLIGACSDVTAYKQVEDELAKARDAADQANRSKSLFLASVSHELRTPLTAILGFSELLYARMTTDDYAKGVLEVVLRNGRHVTSIVGDILDFAAIEAGALTVEPTEVHLDALLDELRLLFEAKASGKGLALRIAAVGDLPKSIYLDPKRFKQILINLLDNAVKFTPHGEVSAFVNVAADPKDESLYVVEMLVSDTGIGIRDDHAQRLFQPFVQGEPSLTRQAGGTGLGLALSRALARRMGGDVTLLRSSPGQGSTFRATIMAHRAQPGSTAPTSPEADLDAVIAEADIGARAILVVEDTPDSQKLIHEFLIPTGASIVVADCGEDAVHKVSERDFDLILMDLRMPGLDGYETLGLLRRNGYESPVVALTAHAGYDERKRAIEAGFDGYLVKPIDRVGLIRTIGDKLKAKAESHS